MEVKKVLVSAFLLTTCLKCDFHMHSVFSDGLVWPTVRVDEAYRDGLDAISLTEHIEYRPHKQDVVSDHNRSFDLCREQAEKLGILLSDSNPLEQKDYKDAFREAKKQGAFMFWNHPGWDSQQPDTTKWWPEHTALYQEGCMHGIEVANGHLYMPEAIQWCLDKNLTMIGTSDIHQPIQTDYDFEKGEHRTMTFVFAKERSLQGIREALDNRRTAAYFHELLIGREDLLRPFFEKCVKIEEVSRNEQGVTLSITNVTDLVLKLKKTAHDTLLVYFRDMTLKPHTRYTVRIGFKQGIKGGDVNFEVTNFIVAPDKGLKYTISL